jgi:hypothetical protein
MSSTARSSTTTEAIALGAAAWMRDAASVVFQLGGDDVVGLTTTEAGNSVRRRCHRGDCFF